MKFMLMILKIITFSINIYFILMGWAMMYKHPGYSIVFSLFCDIINVIAFNIMLKYRYNHYTYRETKMSDRSLVRTMAITAVMLPCSLMNEPIYCFGIAFPIISLFLPTHGQMEDMLKCDQWSLIRKAKEQKEK